MMENNPELTFDAMMRDVRRHIAFAEHWLQGNTRERVVIALQNIRTARRCFNQAEQLAEQLEHVRGTKVLTLDRLE